MAKFWRSWHKSLSIIIVLPFLITIITGLSLLFRDRVNWINPVFPPVSSQLTISFDDILKTSQSVPELDVKTWDDVNRIQIKPSNGSIVVRAKNNYQIQIDGSTAEVVGGGVGRSSILVGLHEGTFWFGNWGRYLIALPMGLIVLFLSISGIVLYMQPTLYKRSLQKKKLK